MAQADYYQEVKVEDDEWCYERDKDVGNRWREEIDFFVIDFRVYLNEHR